MGERGGDAPPRASVTVLPGVTQSGSRPGTPVPEGHLEMVVTSLEMRVPPASPAPRPRAEPLAIIRARPPTLAFYRFLYDSVGADWMWFERRQLAADVLLDIVQDEAVAVYVLYVDGTPAGYAELDSRVAGEVELAYFGLMPEFIGRGLGGYLLDWAVRRAFGHSPDRVWVHTCNFDHPAALALYQKAGFRPYLQERFIIADPRRATAG